MTKHYHIWTEGCQMNVADSRRVASALEHLDYQSVAKAEEADVIVLNTCMVRKSAEDKAIGRLTSLKALKKRKPSLVINVMGCLVGVKPSKKLYERFPFVDVFSSPSDPRPLIAHLYAQMGKHFEEIETAGRFAWLDGDIALPIEEQGQLVSAMLPVMDGCSHACTYCIIPSKRGREESRSPGEILAEARALTDQGVREITLLGQIVDRYGLDKPGYPRLDGLIRQLHAIEGLQRIRFLTSHPNWLHDDLLKTVAEYPKVMPHLEVPVQAGDDAVLMEMRRGYSADNYRALIARARAIIPGVSIGNDIIVGFPGETEEQFEKTVDLIRELRLDVMHLARYSPREGTVSATRLADDVSEEEKWRRFRVLEELQEEISLEIHQAYQDTTTEVLFEEQHRGRWKGRNPNNKLVFVESTDDLRGQILPVKIEIAGAWSLIGQAATK
ncbi:MAG TPA: tRNA (N6-isopentenyl adenosine(37)-C2)-methylthiotransferase MiaB [Chloroflexi bacterium]|nr:tRNA (N6-isopentenyl adenosine(37)-C2)-methylthiotransferase MiaB [Chloroflexota bacterium]